MTLDDDKIRLIEQIQEEALKQRIKLIKTFIPDKPDAKPFKAQEAFFRDKSLGKLARCGNRAAKTYTTMRDLAWKIMRTHWFRQDYNIFGVHDKNWMIKAGTEEFELRYFKTKPKVFWIVGPTYEFINGVMWGLYLEKMIPKWYVSDMRYTNQKNLESVVFKNGDILKCKTYAQQEEAKMGFVVDEIYVDEMPNDVKIITELVVRTLDCDGTVNLGFTPLVTNKDIQNYLDKSCAAGTLMLHRWTIFDNPHYRDNPDRLKRALDEFANMSESERNSRLSGEWYEDNPDKLIFEGIEPELVEDFQIPYTWRQMRVTDPASHVTGHAIFAEDPDSGDWYCHTAVEIAWGHIARAADILDVIEKYRPYSTFKYEKSIYDNAEAWFGAEARVTPGYDYTPCILKNREAAIMQTRNMVAPGKLKFFKRGGALAVAQMKDYKRKKDGIGVVKKNDHVLDCVMYFCREVPKPIPRPASHDTIVREAILNVIANTEKIKPLSYNYAVAYRHRFGSIRPLPKRSMR